MNAVKGEERATDKRVDERSVRGFTATRDDPTGRARRARRVLRLLADFGAPPIDAARLLDLGCRQGAMSSVFAASAREVVGIDVDAQAVAHARSRWAAIANLRFARADGASLPFAAASFDIVVCNHVYEHMPDAPALMAEIHRVLRAGGVCYFAGGHTLQIVEPHHRLPLLSVLPRQVADALVRATGKGRAYEERFLPPWRLRTLFQDFAEAVPLTSAVLRDARRYELFARSNRALEMVLGAVPAWAAWLAPTYLWLLRK